MDRSWAANPMLVLTRTLRIGIFTMATIFIDGQAGTTGIEITARLRGRSDLKLLTIQDEHRKDPAIREQMFKQADVAILCLPDDAAREACTLSDSRCRIIDASSAHRVHPEWAYGLPELSEENRSIIAKADKVSNPGCYPQGFVLSVLPLIEAEVLARDTPLRCSAVSGFSGGGRQMIESFRDFTPEQADTYNSQAYGLTQNHKHLPEMQHYSGTAIAPIFLPMVAAYYKGMVTSIALFASELNGATPDDVQTILKRRYASEQFIQVAPVNANEQLTNGYLNPTACNGTNNLELMVFGDAQRVVINARYDNLGKGAAGAAIQNLNIMLGKQEDLGL